MIYIRHTYFDFLLLFQTHNEHFFYCMASIFLVFPKLYFLIVFCYTMKSCLNVTLFHLAVSIPSKLENGIAILFLFNRLLFVSFLRHRSYKIYETVHKTLLLFLKVSSVRWYFGESNNCLS